MMKKSTKRRILAAALGCCLILSGCGSKGGRTKDGGTTEIGGSGNGGTTEIGGSGNGGTTENGGGGGGENVGAMPENEIILVEEYSNGAWIHAHHGSFIMSNGDKYSFNFDSLSWGVGCGDFTEALMTYTKYAEPYAKVDTDFLEKLYTLGVQVNPDAKMELRNECCDYGENEWIFHDPETDRYITIYESGDNTGGLDDPYADQMYKKWEKEIDAHTTILESEPEKNRILIPKAIPMTMIAMPEKDMPVVDSSYYLTGDEKLKKAEAKWGLDFSEFYTQMDNFVRDTYVYDENEFSYFIEFIDAEICEAKGIDESSTLDGFMIGPNKFRFLVGHSEGEKASSNGKGMILITALPTVDVDFNQYEYEPIEGALDLPIWLEP